MTKKKNMKKMLNVLTAKAIIISSISGAVLTPSLSALAAEGQNVVGAATTESDLISKDLSLENNRFKNFVISSAYTNTPNAATAFQMTGTDPNWYAMNGQTFRMVNKANPFSYYLPETFLISQATGSTAVIIDTEVDKTYVFDYSYSLSNSNAKTASANSKLSMEVGVSQYGGDKIKYNTYSLAGNQETKLTDKAQIEFKATSTKTIVYMNAGYTSMNTSGAKHFASLDSYSLKAAKDPAEEQAQLVAEQAVADLFVSEDVNGTIKDSTTQEAINTAKELVAAITDADKKAELEVQLAEAQKQVDAKTAENEAEQGRQETATDAVKDLFSNNDVTGTIKDNTTQDAINTAKELVAAITDAVKKAELEAQLAEAQKQVDAKTEDTAAEQARQETATNAVKELFNNNDVTGTIKDSTTQEAINTAKELVAAITDAAKKAELEAQLIEAQKQVDAKTSEAAEQARQETATDAVKELFNNNDTTGTIKDNTTQEAINNAKELVAAITDADKKAELEAQLTEAQKQVDAKTAENEAEQGRQETATDAVKDLFNNNDTTGTIKDNTTQEAIDNAKELVATITDADKKAELEKAITEAQKQLTEKETKVEVTGKGNTFTLQQDRYLTGTYTGDVASMSVDINGKRYYGGTVKNGEFSFYALDKIAKETDEVLVNLHGADKSIQTTFAVVVKSPTKITSNAYKLKDSNITGTFNNTDITKMNVVVNGKTYWGGTVANGEFKFYALDKITSATDEVTMNFFNANNELIISKNLTITAPVVTSGEITSATLAVGDKNIVGTITGDIKSFGVTIDGTTYNGGTIAADGTFKFYVADKKFTADSVITIVAYDKSKNTLSEMNIVVSK
ncbi:immunoglobulin-like domain-containing protein [Listeria booriae]|uniref:Bacterial Ig domain-containing protein n=1 Tax=Listeria booriae TaxID=1552123 RepID=A0A842EVQ7_9LIST|nr:immunoglobulin-like domain-containing protein [Listeria booriae]MBC2240568.1 hypothetical protein [Listeria booriae]